MSPLYFCIVKQGFTPKCLMRSYRREGEGVAKETNNYTSISMYLEHIQSPADVKALAPEQLPVLADECRHALLQKLSDHGGHIGPNLGMVEATVALHRVFDSPVDRIVFDVSHQSYVHKMLTGRAEAFLSAAYYDDVSGYTEPSESVHDQFVIGHTSTSVSLACGLAKGRDLKGGHENVIAVIGDGSLSGGEALEGLDMAAELGTNLIIIVNDNQMSIAENHGGLYHNLKLLRETKGTAQCNLFRAMGLDYLYVDKGNDVFALIEAFEKVKGTDHPVVVHINTLKGKGYRFAEEQKERFHWGFPFDLPTGETKPAYRFGPGFGELTAGLLLEEMKADPSVVALTAGTPGIWGWPPEMRKKARKQFVDVGIAEETAVAMISGIAKRGGHPVFGVHSSFIQRAYDQLSQDLSINDNPATIVVFGGGLSGLTDVTHLGHFDIVLLSHIPNLIYLAPTSKEEYVAMLRWSIPHKEHPVVIRVPAVGIDATNDATPLDDYSGKISYDVTHRGSQVALIGAGTFYGLAAAAVSELADKGIDATLINPRVLSALDTATLDSLKDDHRLVITLEDGQAEGGFGETIARYYGNTDVRVCCLGGQKEFVDRYDPAAYLEACGLTVEQIVATALDANRERFASH